MKSISFWQENTCIDFAFNTTGQNSILFIQGSGCYSNVGRIWYWPQQHISIDKRCEHFHTIAHEIGYALGFFHTHNRADRDYHVSINVKNAKKGLEKNFKKETFIRNNNYGIPYEYGSVMHYSKKAFSSNGRRTITSKDSLFADTMGSGTGPSFFDFLMMNTHYYCLSRCQWQAAKCENGGYPHPRRCHQCICPSSFGGLYCEKKAYSLGCGDELRALRQWQTLNGTLGDGTYRDDMSYCYWWILSRETDQIEVRIDLLEGICSEGCIYGGLELKVLFDKRTTGYRFCCRRSIGIYMRADGPNLPVILFNRKSYTRFIIRYRSF